MANALAHALQDEFGVEAVQVEMIKDIGKTGNCEVVLKNTSKLLHSSHVEGAQAGSAEATQAVFDRLQAWFDEH